MSKIIYDLTGDVEKIIVDLTEDYDVLDLIDAPMLDSPLLVSPTSSPLKRQVSDFFSDFFSDSEDDPTPLKALKLTFDTEELGDDSDDDSMSIDTNGPPFKDFDLEVTYEGIMDKQEWENIPSNVVGLPWWRQDNRYVHIDTQLTTFEVCVWPYETYGDMDWVQAHIYCYDLQGREGYVYTVDLRCLRNTYYDKNDLAYYLGEQVMSLVRERSALLRSQYKAPFRHVADCLAHDYTKQGCSPATATVLLNRDLALFLDSFN
jgi:hypothetical protein